MALKKYLNNKQRKDLVLVGIILDAVERVALEWKKYGNLTSNESRWLRTAATLMVKAVTSIAERIDVKEAAKLKTEIERTSVMCIPKSDVKWKQEQLRKEIDNEEVIVSKENLFNLAELALTGCTVDCGKDPETCFVKQIYFDLNIDVWDFEGKNECPYRKV
jgi:hypothetical protein